MVAARAGAFLLRAKRGGGGERSETEGAAAVAGYELDASSTCDTADVTLDVLIRIDPELRHGDEAAVHGLGRAGTDAVAVGHGLDQLEVGAVIERSAG